MYDVISEKDVKTLVEKVKAKVQQGWMPVGGMQITYTLVKKKEWRDTQSLLDNDKMLGKTTQLVTNYDVEYTYHQTITQKVQEVHSTVDILSGCVCNCGGGE